MNCLCRPSRTISVRIVLLDETDFLHEIKDDLSGQALLDVVFGRLNLIETAYFGLRHLDEENQTHWLDPSTRISRQCRGSADVYDMYFGVKFYAADPTKLIEEITRYQLFLQVKQDVLQGRLPVSFELAAELGAFIVQSELGDYDARRNSIGYVSEFRLVANQSGDLENRVNELHQQLRGMSPSAAELNYLDKVKWHDMYGVDLHPVLVSGNDPGDNGAGWLPSSSRHRQHTIVSTKFKNLPLCVQGEDSVEYFLGLTPSGIVVLRNKTTVAYYYWPRIAKVYFKGRYFMLRVCDKNNEVSTYGFETPRKSACRHLWRCCVEHHAFFRLVRVAPLQPQEGTGELFSLGSRFRYSGRTEKQAVRDALAHGRSPPNFKRTPSRRQPRRSFDDMLESSKTAAAAAAMPNGNTPETKSISIPQPAQAFDSPYRSTCLVPSSLSLRQYPDAYGSTGGRCTNGTPDSPRSTRSAPWSRTQQKGLFGVTASPRSVRSATTRKNSTILPTTTQRFRSSSVESQSSNDSKSCRKHRRRRQSDNESELSRGSGRSHNSHRKHRHQRSKHRRGESGSDNESGSRARSFSGHRKSSGSMELIDSNVQWHDVQRRQSELTSASAVQQASVTKSSSLATTKHQPHSGDTDSQSHGSSHNRSRRHKKNRSPSDRSRVWSSELAKHLQFDLVDTAGMTEDQLREIPYTVVETHSSKRPAANAVKVHKNSSGSSGGNNTNRVDRIRGIYLPESNGGEPMINGSIRSASTISSRECDRNSSLVRMMSSLSMGDFISPSGSCLSPLDESGLRVSHEHTDSGLGADQDYAYSSERSSDSKYGTNKSSGTSVTSGNHNINQKTSKQQSQHNHQSHSNGGGGHESVSSRKPPVHPSLQQTNRHSIAPVHSSNNRLYNNTVFHNNQYTFSLNRDGGEGCGFLEAARPLSATSLYGGDGGKVSRGTKSDIGVPCRRPPSSSSSSTAAAAVASSSSSSSKRGHHSVGNQQHHSTSYASHRANLPSVKSDFLLSYLNNSAYHISSGVSASTDYLENYKTVEQMHHHQQRMFSTNSSSRLDCKSTAATKSPYGHLQSKYQPHQHQQQRTHSSSEQTKQRNHYNASVANANIIGPLLYLDYVDRTMSGPQTPPRNHHQTTTMQNNPSSDRLRDAFLLDNLSHHTKLIPPTMPTCNSNNSNISNTNQSTKSASTRSASLELILTPIIQSSRRAQ